MLFSIVATVAMFACGDNNNLTPTSPSTPGCNLTTTQGCTPLTFTGSVNRNGAMTHNFSSTASGIVSATLTALGPDSSQVIGMSLGTFNGNVCSSVLSNDRSTQGTVVNGSVSSLGSLCVRVYDVGNITDAEPFTYEIAILVP